MTIRAGSGRRVRLVALVRLLAAISLLAVGAVHVQQYIVQDYRAVAVVAVTILLAHNRMRACGKPDRPHRGAMALMRPADTNG